MCNILGVGEGKLIRTLLGHRSATLTVSKWTTSLTSSSRVEVGYSLLILTGFTALNSVRFRPLKQFTHKWKKSHCFKLR